MRRIRANSECAILERSFYAVGLGSLVLFTLLGFTPLVAAVAKAISILENPQPAHAIVILAHTASPRGGLSDESAARMYHGIDLYKRGLAPLIVFSGRDDDVFHSEAEVRRQFAKGLGVPLANILCAGGRTTANEAAQHWATLSPKGIREILLVTDAVHMIRAQAVFEKAGFTVHPAPPPGNPSPETPAGRIAMVHDLLADVFGLLYYRVRGLI